MAQRQSVQFLAQQLMGLGDRARNSAQQDKANALQQRAMALQEGQMKETQKRMASKDAIDRFTLAVQTLGSDPKVAAIKVAENMSPEDRALIGPVMGNLLEQISMPTGVTKTPTSTMFEIPQTPKLGKRPVPKNPASFSQRQSLMGWRTTPKVNKW